MIFSSDAVLVDAALRIGLSLALDTFAPVLVALKNAKDVATGRRAIANTRSSKYFIVSAVCLMKLSYLASPDSRDEVFGPSISLMGSHIMPRELIMHPMTYVNVNDQVPKTTKEGQLSGGLCDQGSAG